MPSALTATDLRCEYLTTPVGIDVRQPRLSWRLTSPERGQRQSAYRVTVARSPEALDGRDVLWDSGRITSGQSAQIAYGGPPLESAQRYHWQVEVWDADGAAADRAHAWWETGLVHRSDWVAQWIGADATVFPDFSPPTFDDRSAATRTLAGPRHFRRAFHLDGGLLRGRLYLTALGVYEAHLNGSRLGDAVLTPGWTDYRQRIQYQTYDVTDLLTEGENVLGVLLGEGWYAGYVGFDAKRRGALYGTSPRLLAQLLVDEPGGARRIIGSDDRWRYADGPVIYSDLLMGERYDARRELDGWTAPGFDDSVWTPAATCAPTAARLVSDRAEPVRVTAELAAKAVTRTGPGTYLVDLGQNMVGWVRLRVRGPAGTTVRMRHGEMLDAGGALYTENLRTAEATDTYIVRGSADGSAEFFEPHFTFHGFRYVEVSGYPGDLRPEDVTGCVVGSDTPRAGTFECSDALINQLQRNITWGQRGNFLSVPTDCPQRDERLGWTADAQIFARTASYNADVAAFFTKWMTDVADAQSGEGAFTDVAPKAAFPSDGAPAWGDAGIIIPWELYQLYGDTRVIETHYAAMQRWLDYILAANPDLLWRRRRNRNFGDWLSIGADTPKDVLATAYFAHDADLLSRMAAAIGYHDDAKRYRALFDDIRHAFCVAYVSAQGRVQGETQTGYLLALAMDLLLDELREPAARHLADNIRNRGGHLSTGFVGVRFLCPVLSEMGYHELACELVTQESFPSWGYSIRQGATTIWERWDGWTADRGFQAPAMNSFNHYSLGSVGEWLYRYVAGIDVDPREPGYRHVILAPRPGGRLDWARARYDSMAGPISSEWHRTGAGLDLRVSLPANTRATLHLPAARAAAVLEGAGPVQDAPGVRLIDRSDRVASYALSSGDFHFQVQ